MGCALFSYGFEIERMTRGRPQKGRGIMITQVICVLGESYSGSTLLNMILDTHPGITGVGELIHIFMSPKTISCSFCGDSCRYFSKQNIANIIKSDPYNAIANIFGTSVIVDTSKEIVNFQKMLEHQDLSKVNLLPVMLVKHPMRHLASFVMHMVNKASSDPVKVNEIFENPQAKLALTKQVLSQRIIAWYRGVMPFIERTFNNNKLLVLKYESLVERTMATLKPILDLTGLEAEKDMENFTSAEHHHIAGNGGAIYFRTKNIKSLDDCTGISLEYYESLKGITMDNKYLNLFPVFGAHEEMDLIKKDDSYRQLCEFLGYHLTV